MQIFVLDRNPLVAASSLADCHVVKMCLETAQILTAILKRECCCLSNTFPQPQNVNHPVIKAVNTPAKIMWVYSYFENLLDEYETRFNKIHAYARFTQAYATGLNFIHPGIMNVTGSCNGLARVFTGFSTNAEDIVEAHRDYYRHKKKIINRWSYTKRQEPEWLKETKKENKMKKYTIYYTIKMNSTAYEYALDVEAANAQEAKKKCKELVLKETGRNAFQPSTKAPNCKCFTGLPPKKI